MAYINDYFDKVLVINLKKDVDKMKKVDALLKSHHIDYERVEGVDGRSDKKALAIFDKVKNNPLRDFEISKGTKVVTNGKVGCLMSHLKCYEMIKKNKWGKTLIFEDDIIFSKDFDEQVKILDRIPDTWYLLYLGASDYRWKQNRKRPASSGLKGYYLGLGGSGRFAYAIHQRSIDHIMEAYADQDRWDIPGDVILKDVQRHRSVFIYPNIVIADVTQSSLRGGRDMFQHASKIGWDLSLFDIKKERKTREEYLNVFSSMIRDGKDFTFVKFGDGEFYSFTRKTGANCDGQSYNPELGKKVRQSFIDLSKFAFIADFRMPERDVLEKQYKLMPNYVYFDLLLHNKQLTLVPELRMFFETVRDSYRKKVYIGPERLSAVVPFLNIDKFVKVPQMEAFSKYPSILSACKALADNHTIFMFSCGMTANALINDLTKYNNKITCIDLGSSLDPLLFGRTRKSQVDAMTLREYYEGFTLPDKMPHFYQEIEGWFNFQDLYTMMVDKVNKKALFVEVGCYMGKSTSYLGVEIINSGKDIKVDVIDTFKGSPEHQARLKGKEFYRLFLRNTRHVAEVLNPIQSDSVEASKNYKDKSIDFVFIDANHDYEFVKADIEAWLPKVKKGGHIGGHDYKENWPGVVAAVDEIFGDNKQIIGTSWLVQKK